MAVTLKDLAKTCGCSVTSVSRALKDSDTISKALRYKVQQKASELGYIPNLLAGSMRTGYTNTIAVILPDLRNPYFSLLAKYAEEYASHLGYSVFFMTTNEISTHEYSAVMKSMQKNVDGILLLPNQLDTDSIDIMNKMNFPYVLFGRVFDKMNSDSVIINDEKGGYIATQHLVAKGHKKILCLNSYMHIYSSQARLRGYQKALNEAGIPFDENDIRYISTKISAAKDVVMEIFSKKCDYTAIFCYCDVLAFEAVYILNRLGFNIPEDIAITSTDDIHSEIVLPVKITSVGFNRAEYMKTAIDLLIERIKHPLSSTENKKYVHKIIDVSLSTGQTT